ncbi:MAG: MEDS domain-containing protein [Desulfosoma sp.]|uniref:MEDS domain-containing protein n=1 Tax=Desulfosoma sp. TaxID=2603217 RepID=UPI00404B3D4A
MIFHRAESIYVPHGVFDPDRVLSLFVSCVQSALEMGFTSARVVSDALWLLAHPLGAHQVVEYEHRVNRVAAGMPCSLLCLYPGKAFLKAFLAYILLSHPYVFKKDRCFWNPRYENFDTLMQTRFDAAVYDTFIQELVPIHT